MLIISCSLLLLSFFDVEAVTITTDGATINFDNVPYFIKGVNYSPSPIGKAITEPPYGDFYTVEYQAYWARDLPLLSAMGANTVRISHWNASANHMSFLDAAHKAGLKVLVTFFEGMEQFHSIVTSESRTALLASFVDNVKQYAGHPALLGWVFGNEMNNPAYGYLATLNIAYNCNWNAAFDPQGCYFSPANEGSWCAPAVRCMYSNLFSFLNSAAQQAHEAMLPHRHLVISVFADVDILLKRIVDFEGFAPHIDAWGVDVYKGPTFGQGSDDFLTSFEQCSKKPLIITEYGYDVYDDPCGRSNESPCYNSLTIHPQGFGENQRAQSEWDTNLASLQLEHSSAVKKGSCAGGFLMSWLDELWRSAVGVKVCWGVPYGQPGFNPGQCEYKAHADCPNRDVSQQSLCGQWFDSAYDKYLNPSWFGIMRTEKSDSTLASSLDKLTPRQVYYSMQALWNPVNRTWLFLTIATLVVGLAVCITVLSIASYKRDVAAMGSKSEQAPLLSK